MRSKQHHNQQQQQAPLFHSNRPFLLRSARFLLYLCVMFLWANFFFFFTPGSLFLPVLLPLSPWPSLLVARHLSRLSPSSSSSPPPCSSFTSLYLFLSIFFVRYFTQTHLSVPPFFFFLIVVLNCRHLFTMFCRAQLLQYQQPLTIPFSTTQKE